MNNDLLLNSSKVWNLNTFFSNLKETNEPVIVGIDEAGRGPVIGPMVYALYVSYPTAKSSFKDSKVLSPAQRENLFKSIQLGHEYSEEVRGYCYFKIHPSYITSQMEDNNLNLNEISRQAVVILLNELKSKCTNIISITIDALGDNEKYKSYLKTLFNFNFIVENKADSNHQIVSAASIIAKVTRDEEFKTLNCGSGYPSDPATQRYILNNIKPLIGLPNIVRHSWKTVKSILSEKKDMKLLGDLNGFYLGPK